MNDKSVGIDFPLGLSSINSHQQAQNTNISVQLNSPTPAWVGLYLYF